MVFAVIEAWNFQIALRLRRNSLAPFAVLFGRYPG